MDLGRREKISFTGPDHFNMFFRNGNRAEQRRIYFQKPSMKEEIPCQVKDPGTPEQSFSFRIEPGQKIHGNAWRTDRA